MSADDVRVARVGVEEWPAFKALRLEALQREPAAFGTTYAQAVAWPDEAWRERLGNPRCVSLMARVVSVPVGMVAACRGDEGDERVGLVISMYVHERYRRQGVGRMLLAAAVDALRGFPEIETIRLWVRETHLPARRLYESFGFRLTGAEGDLLVMERGVGDGE